MRYERDGFSVESAIKKKRPLPDWYLDEPPAVPGAEFFYVAYRDLQSCRAPDGPIPWTATMRYAEHKNLRNGMGDVLWGVVSRMDLAERRWRLEELKRETGG